MELDPIGICTRRRMAKASTTRRRPRPCEMCEPTPHLAVRLASDAEESVVLFFGERFFGSQESCGRVAVSISFAVRGSTVDYTH